MAELVLLWLRKNWLTLLLCAIMFVGYKYHQHLVKEAYQDGYSESQADAANESQKREVALRTERERRQWGGGADAPAGTIFCVRTPPPGDDAKTADKLRLLLSG